MGSCGPIYFFRAPVDLNGISLRLFGEVTGGQIAGEGVPLMVAL